jgi:23S rRNA (cytosine1962-C5)-methyltransferase
VAEDPLTSLPVADTRRIAVRLTPDATRQVRGGHPWVYAPSITSTSHDGAPGDLAVVFDDTRRFVAIGLWDPRSPIRLKVLHQGRPVPIDTSWWASRIEDALARRRSLVDDPTTTGYRCIHGENDGFPGLVLDRYSSTLVLKVYSGAWFPHLATIVPLLRTRLDPESIVLRLGRLVQRADTFGLADGMALAGTTPTEPVPFLEHGLRFEAPVAHGHKTGHFLDQRENRALVRSLARGARVLDVFSYTGGFSLHAAAGGARAVHAVDQSAPALAAARRAFDRNRDLAAVGACHYSQSVGDAFAIMRSLGAQGIRYDIVVVDPPSFASKQADAARARRAYAQLTQLAVALLEPGGLLVQASCSSRVPAEAFFATVTEAARQVNAPLTELARTGHAIDHPIGFPEGAYLKALLARTPGSLRPTSGRPKERNTD